MKYLRLSFYVTMTNPPVTTIVKADDLRIPIEEALDRQIKAANEENVFAIGEVIERTDELPSATMAIMQAIDGEKEHNMAIQFFWPQRFQAQIAEGGSILPNPHEGHYPAPFSAADARNVLEQLSRTPDWRSDIRLECHTKDGAKLQLHEGKVTNV